MRNGAVLARSSQPEVGLLGWRCNEDEKLLSSIAKSALQNSWTSVALGNLQTNQFFGSELSVVLVFKRVILVAVF